MRTTLRNGTRIDWTEPTWKRTARRLTIAALLTVLAIGVLGGCSLGPHSRHLHPNLDKPRDPEHVTITERSTAILPANVHCAYQFADDGHHDAALFAGLFTLTGNVVMGCASGPPIPPRVREQADSMAAYVMVQSEDCERDGCECTIVYMGWPGESNPIWYDEYMHCLGYVDEHPKVRKLAYDERLFERDQDR